MIIMGLGKNRAKNPGQKVRGGRDAPLGLLICRADVTVGASSVASIGEVIVSGLRPGAMMMNGVLTMPARTGVLTGG